MANLRNKRKMAALYKKNCEEHPNSNLAQNTNVPRSQEDYITQIFEESEGKVTKNLSQDLNRTEKRIFGALARLDDFLMNPPNQGHSGTAPETSWKVFGTNQGTNEDDSRSDPHPETGIFRSQTTLNFGPKAGHDNNFFTILIFFRVIFFLRTHKSAFKRRVVCHIKKVEKKK